MGNTAMHKMPKKAKDSPERNNPFPSSDGINKGWSAEPLVRIYRFAS